MAPSQVRAVLWQHLHRSLGAADGFAMHGGPVAERTDPNALVDAGPFCDALEAIRRERGDGALQELGRSYVRLWARTFCNLVRHLRGRPEHAVRLFVDEVYPFLRGHRLAARVESTGNGRARLALHGDLPEPYLCGMVSAFVELSQAEATTEALGGDVFRVWYRIRAPDRMARAFVHLSALRIPFLVSALMAALVGVSLARLDGPVDLWRAAVVLAGAGAVQAGANALHDLRETKRPGPFGPPRPHPAILWALALGGYGLAASAGIWLAATGTPWVLAFAAAGLAPSLLYDRFRDHGLGPALAGLSYGPLVTLGALHAMVGFAAPDTYRIGATASLAMGALAAAIVYINDLADRPLDEAAGRRTLLVRLPRTGHVLGYGTLMAIGAATLAATAWFHLWWLALAGLAAGAAGTGLVVLVRTHIDDPHGLTPARAGTLALHAATAVTLVIALGAP